MILEILSICSFKSINCWLHLLLELKEDMPSEPLTKLRELLDQASIISSEKYENANWDILRVPR